MDGNRQFKRVSLTDEISDVRNLMKSLKLHTVCEEAVCPNLCECYARKTATFIILGDTCTRNCSFCAVEKGIPGPVDGNEPERLSRAVKELGLGRVVITSVTRDDLPDGGAGHFVSVVEMLRKENKGLVIEVLVPDFKGRRESIELIVMSRPDIISHNIETVPRLYGRARAGASYKGSLGLIKRVKDYSKIVNNSPEPVMTKSGLMVGLGETADELNNAMSDLRAAGCDFLTIGQYLRPSSRQAEVIKHYTQREFDGLRDIALRLGFRGVKSGYFVRSSYMY